MAVKVKKWDQIYFLSKQGMLPDDHVVTQAMWGKGLKAD